jgi:hypothetical protein
VALVGELFEVAGDDGLVAEGGGDGEDGDFGAEACVAVCLQVGGDGVAVVAGFVGEGVDFVVADVVAGLGEPGLGVGSEVGGHEGVVSADEGVMGGVVGTVQVAV